MGDQNCRGLRIRHHSKRFNTSKSSAPVTRYSAFPAFANPKTFLKDILCMPAVPTIYLPFSCSRVRPVWCINKHVPADQFHALVIASYYRNHSQAVAAQGDSPIFSARMVRPHRLGSRLQSRSMPQSRYTHHAPSHFRQDGSWSALLGLKLIFCERCCCEPRTLLSRECS
jgi:hypothetical protein